MSKEVHYSDDAGLSKRCAARWRHIQHTSQYCMHTILAAGRQQSASNPQQHDARNIRVLQALKCADCPLLETSQRKNVLAGTRMNATLHATSANMLHLHALNTHTAATPEAILAGGQRACAAKAGRSSN